MASTALNRSLQDRLNERQDKLARLHRKTRKKLRRGDVHDLRVSARQLIAGLELLEPLEAPVAYRKTRKELKRLLNSLRELRDLQVERRRLSAEEENPDVSARRKLGPFLERLKKMEKRASSKAIRGLDGFKLRRVGQEVRALAHYLDRSGAFGAGFNRELQALAERHVQERYRKVLEAIRALPRHTPSALEIHEVRIRFKRFRYAWELLEPFLAHRTNSHASLQSALKEFQTLLGEIQDLHVLLGTLAEYDGTQAQSKLAGYARTLARRQGERIAVFERRGPSMLAPFRACFRQRPPGGRTSAPSRRKLASVNSRKRHS